MRKSTRQRCASIDGPRLDFRAASGALEGYIGGVQLLSTTTPDELEHQYAIRTDGTTHVLLIDGVPVKTVTGAMQQPTVDLYEGSNSGTSEHLNDYLNTNRIYDRALSNEELKALL